MAGASTLQPSEAGVRSSGAEPEQHPESFRDGAENAFAPVHIDVQVDSDYAASENGDTDIGAAILEDDAQELVGVSIGQAQTVMKSVQTPADEKEKAMEDLGEDFRGDEERAFPMGQSEAGDMTQSPIEYDPPLEARSKHRAQSSLPSPWQAPSTLVLRSDASRSFLRDSFANARRRSSSGGSTMADSLKKLLPNLSNLNLPKGPNMSSFSFSLGPKDEKASSGDVRPKRSNTLFSFNRSTSPERIDEHLRQQADEDAGEHAQNQDSRPSLLQGQFDEPRTYGMNENPLERMSPHSAIRPKSLRRATSDSSLFIRRTQSRTSTLDDAHRWENIQDQVNSRFKAIKDSLQDTSIRIPKMPNVSLPSVNLAAFRPDFQYARTHSDSARPDPVPDTTENRAVKAEPRFVPIRHKSAGDAISHDVKNAHPILTKALTNLKGDVVVLGGYRGSVLRSAKPPHRQLWVPVKVGLNLRKVDLEVGLEPEDEERMEETIIPSGTLSHIGPIDICRRLIKKLRKCRNAQKGDLRVWDYGYDWRLSPHLSSQKFIHFLEGLESNRPGAPQQSRGAYVIAHSLGGLITRHAINQRPDLFAGVVYAGVPQHCVNILGPLRNGDDVLLSSRVLTAQVNFTLRTSFVLLPESGHCFINKQTGERYDVDFFNVKTWETYRLSPCIAPPLPPMTYEHRRSLIDTVSSTLPSLPLVSKRSSTALRKEHPPEKEHSLANRAQESVRAAADDAGNEVSQVAHEMLHPGEQSLEPSMAQHHGGATQGSIATACTIPKPAAMAYLKRTLADVLRFKRELAFQEELQTANVYPPAAVLYGKSVPTVYGARVASRDAIKHSDAYDDLAFAGGDGVCLARAAQIPEGYRVVKGGLVKSDRGHVGLLGDLEAVGECLTAIIEGRIKGIGLGRD